MEKQASVSCFVDGRGGPDAFCIAPQTVGDDIRGNAGSDVRSLRPIGGDSPDDLRHGIDAAERGRQVNRRTNGHWLPVTQRDPCPACGHSDWCAWTPDGKGLRCMRGWQNAEWHEAGQTRRGRRNGVPVRRSLAKQFGSGLQHGNASDNNRRPAQSRCAGRAIPHGTDARAPRPTGNGTWRDRGSLDQWASAGLRPMTYG